jgi:hypothetical protein
MRLDDATSEGTPDEVTAAEVKETIAKAAERLVVERHSTPVPANVKTTAAEAAAVETTAVEAAAMKTTTMETTTMETTTMETTAVKTAAMKTAAVETTTAMGTTAAMKAAACNYLWKQRDNQHRGECGSLHPAHSNASMVQMHGPSPDLACVNDAADCLSAMP